MKSILTLFLFAFNFQGISQTVSPSVINTTGGTGTAGAYTIEWNVGESMMTTQTNGFIVTNGQLQPVDGIISVQELHTNWNVEVYPNPARDEFVITAPQAGIFEATLYDLAGKLISKQLLMTNNRIDVGSLAAGSYYMQIRNTSNQELKTIKLIKVG